MPDSAATLKAEYAELHKLKVECGTMNVTDKTTDVNQKNNQTTTAADAAKGDVVEIEGINFNPDVKAFDDWEVKSGKAKLDDPYSEKTNLTIEDDGDVTAKAYYMTPRKVNVVDENGNVTEIAAEYDPDSRGGDPADGRKVKGATLHWVDAATAIDAEVRVYSELFSDPAPDGADKDFLACMNPDSLETLTGCKVEARMRDVAAGYDKTEKQGKTAPSFQFMRLGYFCLDNKDCSADHLVFNRSVTLKDSFKV